MELTAQRILFSGSGIPLTYDVCNLPDLTRGEVLVKVVATALCRSDVHTYAGRRREPTPIILGHEVVGQIAAFGPGAPQLDATGESLQLGSRITWALAVSCGSCFFCLDDIPQKCVKLFKYGHSKATEEVPLSGGLATHIVLRAGTEIYCVPPAIPDAVATLANCSTSTAIAVIKRAAPLAGRSILILGAGLLGLTGTALAKSKNASVILVCDKHRANLERARQFGATDVSLFESESLIRWVKGRTEGRGVDFAVELSGALDAARSAIDCCRVGGTAIFAGTAAPVGSLLLDPEMVVRKMLTIIGVHNYRPDDLDSALEFLAGEGSNFPFESLLSSHFSLEDADKAFLAAESAVGKRIVIYP